jgi:hypothetical protein
MSKRFVTAEASLKDVMKASAKNKSSPDLKKMALSKKENNKDSTNKKRSGKSPRKNEREGEKSEAAEGKAGSEKEKTEMEKERREKEAQDERAGGDAAAAAQDERRLQRSRSLSAIKQVAEEMEHAHRSASASKEIDAVTEELKGPLPVRADMTDRQRKRNQVINEIVNTERAYVHDLQTLITLFM